MTIVSAEYNRHSGLGNKLFSWSRSEIFADQNNCKMVEPIWFSPRGAAITRGGIDYSKALKKIWLWKNFKEDKNCISSLQYLVKYKKLSKKFVSNLSEANEIDYREDQHIIFKSTTAHNFSDLHGYEKFLLEKLRAITIQKELNFADSIAFAPFIGVNIRTGKDFLPLNCGKPGYYLTQIEWFVSAIKKVRSTYGNLPAYIISDGGEKQLQQVLKLKDTRLINSKTAIADLLILTQAKVLLGSGNSSFSAWASFLGGMDTFSSPQTPFRNFAINTEDTKQLVSVF